MRTLYYHLPIALCFWALCYFDFIRENIYATGLFNFVTWAVFVVMTLCLTPEAAKRIHESYRAGKHAPAWFDFITYIVPILFCAAFENYAKAGAWTIAVIIDFAYRQKAKQPETRAQESGEEKSFAE